MEIKKVEKTKLNDVTLALCKRLDIYKDSVKRDMTKGDTKVMAGVELVQEFIREINPCILEEKISYDSEFMLDNYRKLKEGKMQCIVIWYFAI